MKINTAKHLKNNLKIKVFYIVLIGLIGSTLLMITHAATPATSVQPESGSLTGSAGILSDQSASGDSAIRFGNSGIRNMDASGIGFNYTDYPSHTDAEQKRDFASMKADGATWIRLGITWSAIQPSASGAYTWSKYDTYVNNAVDAGLKVDGILMFAPSWARKDECKTDNSCPPADPAQYAQFAQAAVQHYGSKLSATEIWNEPNIYQFWKPIPDVNAYVTMLKDAYTAIKTVDPNMLVMTAGLSVSYNDTTNHHYIDHRDYLQQMYDLGAKNYFDAVAYHPYSGSQPASSYQVYSGWSQIYQTPKSMRSVMVANGDADKRIWLTEYGAPTGGPTSNITATCADYNHTGRPNVDECLQAKMLSEAVTIDLQQSDILGPMSIYSFIDRGLPGGETQENHFGVENIDTTHKQSYDAVHDAITANQ